MTFAIDMIAHRAIVAVAVLLAVDMEGAGWTGVGTDVPSPAHGAVALPSDGVAVTLAMAQ